jgi:DNA modification methylase
MLYVRGIESALMFKPTYTTSALLTMFTEEGDVVLDPFAGYGSIPLVCELFNRRWIAVEIDPVKYAVAERVIRERRVVSIKRLKKEIAEDKQQRRTLLEFVGVKK